VFKSSRAPEVSWPTWLCAAAPTLFLVTLWTAVFHVRVALGHWPKFGEPVPGPFWSIHQFVLIWMGGTAMFVALPLALILALFPALRGHWRYHLGQFVVFAMGGAVAMLWIRLDPWRWLNWFQD
jgi:hypothetical protein